jgi:hypothetical protein
VISSRQILNADNSALETLWLDMADGAMPKTIERKSPTVRQLQAKEHHFPPAVSVSIS